MSEKAPERIYLHNPWNIEQEPCGCEKDIPYVPASALATARREEREAVFKETIKIVQTQPSTTGDWMTQSDVAANLRRKIVWALESAAKAGSEDKEV